MSAHPQELLASFLVDTERLLLQAHQCVNKMTTNFRDQEKVKIEDVQSFFQIVHTLKGTASMLDSGLGIVESLHSLESHLVSQSLEDSASKPVWLPQAEQALYQVSGVIQKLNKKASQEKAGFPSLSLVSETSHPLLHFSSSSGKMRENRIQNRIQLAKQKEPKGVLIRTNWVSEKLKTSDGLTWFPLSSLLQVFTLEELAGRKALVFQSAWIPVLGGLTPSQEAENFLAGFGLVAELGFSEMKTGRAVIVAQEVLSICTQSQAEISAAA